MVDGYVLNKTGQETDNILENAMLKGVDYVTAGKALNTTVGQNSTAEGAGNTVTGDKAHGEGAGNKARALATHVEGNGNDANGVNAHAEGRSNTVTGSNAHVEGTGNIANHKSQHVFGEYNEADDSAAAGTERGNYAEIVGNGESDSNRSNARTLDWNGNEVLAGKLTVGKDPEDDMDAATLKAVKEKVYDSLISESVSGAIVSFTDGADNIPVKSLSVTLSPIQSLNGYDNPWPAGGGKNKFGLKNVSAIANGANKTLTVVNEKITVAATGAVASTEIIGNVAMPVAIENSTLKAGTYYFKIFDFVAPAFPAGTQNGFKVGITVNGVTTEYAPDTAFTLSADGTIEYISSPTLQWNAGNTMSFYAAIATENLTAWQPYSNICPISGRTEVTVVRAGENWYNTAETEWESGILDDNGYPAATTASHYTGNYTQVSGGTNYILSGSIASANVQVRIYFYDALKNWISRTSGTSATTVLFTTPENCKYIQVQCGSTITSTDDWMLELGSTPTTYVPYTGDSFTIPLGQTVYGGTVEVAGGNGTDTLAGDDMGNIIWTRASYGGVNYFKGEIAGTLINTPITSSKKPMCSIFEPTTPSYIANLRNNTVCYRVDGRGVYIRADEYLTAEAFTAAMTGQTLVLELATPSALSTTPTEVTTLKGDNNVWSDGDSVDVEYRADTGLYIQKMINNG